MEEKEFKNIYQEKLKSVYDFAIYNNFSEFYKIKYKDHLKRDTYEINSYDDFKKIPFLTKNDILKSPIAQRTFIEEAEINRFNLTSGTTTNNKILAIPLGKNERPTERPHTTNDIIINKRKCLIMFPPMSAAFMGHLRLAIANGGIIISGDTSNLKRTAMVVKELTPEIIFTTPTILDFLLKELDEVKFDTASIKDISLGGENTSQLKLDYFKARFPEANIVFRYGSSETGGIRGYRCQYLASESPEIYHPGEVFIEVIDESGTVLSEGEVGEIVHTGLVVPKGFPFIRYKTGDIGSTYYKECPCGNNRILKLGGRATFDVLKFNGITLYAEQIEKALSEFSNDLIPAFEMHVYEESRDGKILPKLILKLSFDSELGKITEKIIQNMVTEKLFLAANKNLKYFVENGIFLPLEVEFVEKDQLSSIKKTGIISHL